MRKSGGLDVHRDIDEARLDEAVRAEFGRGAYWYLQAREWRRSKRFDFETWMDIAADSVRQQYRLIGERQ